MSNYELFKNGSIWVKADFHLHTQADEKFVYKNNPNEFNKEFIRRLKENHIHIGVITNHNKFDLQEFKDLYKKALKEKIFLLPGIELSVKDGSNMIHCLLVFNYEEWFKDGTDFINGFLTTAFEGIPNYSSANTRCRYNLDELLKKLDEYKKDGKDSFIIMAHIEDNCGFYKELKGGRIKELGKNQLFRDLVLGFQKVRTNDYIKNLEQWLDKKLPSFVEGSDCKSIDEVGKPQMQNGGEKITYIKIGDFNFDAVKFALLPTTKRISETIPVIENGYIESITFTGGLLDGKTIFLNNNMNNLIGIRGSGKSSLLETIRYGLEIPFGTKSKDTDYKDSIVYNLLRSGGMIVINIKDEHSKNYRIQRIYNEKAKVYRDGTSIPHLNINNGLLNILYFGQKDLSEIGVDGFSEDLINKFFGNRVLDIRERINNQKEEIIKIIRELKDIEKNLEKKNDAIEEKTTINEQLKKFEEFDIQNKLKKQLVYDKDKSTLKQLTEFLDSMLRNLELESNEYKDKLSELLKIESTENEELFGKIKSIGKNIYQSLSRISEIIIGMKKNASRIGEYSDLFKTKYDGLKDEFANIKRTINVSQINPDDYVKLHSRLNLLEARIEELNKKAERYDRLKNRLLDSINIIDDLYHKEYRRLKEAADELNKKKLSITIDLKYKDDKDAFLRFMTDNLKGTRVHKSNTEKIVAEYNDTLQIYKDLDNNNSELAKILSGGDQLLNFKQQFREYLETFLTYRVPDKYLLYYKGTELQKLSLGQRASALILFILTKEENDIVIIDQPEDDLDNQTIYTDVIRELNQLKNKTQFIFATHNPNIPVLGDCEQIISCRFAPDKLETSCGSIDCKDIQKEVVEIMEGGEEAFNRRNMIYQIWRD